MGSQLTSCGDHSTLTLDPETHVSHRLGFLQYFKPPNMYVDIHNLFPNLPSIQFMRSLLEDRFIILSASFDGPA